MSTLVRKFRDERGVQWDVWSVRPQNVERRFEKPPTPPGGVERRRRVETRVSIGREMAAGWLAFSSHGERRRLAPIPEGWQQLSDDQLAHLCDNAKPVEGSPFLR